MTDQTPDRFTLPGDIPDAAYWDDSTRTAQAAREQQVLRQAQDEREARGYSASHPAGRGWVPLSRDLGIPSEHESTRAPGMVVIDGVEHSFPFGVPEDVIAACGGSAVFTVERWVRFLDNLAFKGNVRAAAALVGVSHETAYRKRRQDAAFAALWDAAMVHARAYCESQLATRALDGVEVPVFHRGELIAYRVVHDPRLLLAHLGRLDKRVETDAAARERAGRFDELLAEYAGQEARENFAEAAAVPGLPPTRAEYVAWARGKAVEAPPEGADEVEVEAWHAAEAEAVDELGAEAGAEWDAWHAAALERVEAILGEGETSSEPPVEFKSVPPRNGEGDHAKHGGGGSPHPLRLGQAPTTTPLRAAVPLPVPGRIQPRNFPAQDRVTPVNPPRPSGGWGLGRLGAASA